MRFAYLLLLVIALNGCAQPHRMYSGPPRSADKIAVLKGQVDFKLLYEVQPVIHSVNDKIITKHQTELLPGVYLIGTQLWFMKTASFHSSNIVMHLLNAKAGHTYIIKGRWKRDKSITWIVDTKTNKVVAGTKPAN